MTLMARNRWVPTPTWLISLLLVLLTLLGAGCGPTAAPTTVPTEPPAPTAGPAVVLGDEVTVEAGGFAFRPIPGYILDVDREEVLMLAPDADMDTGPFFMLTGDSLDDAMPLDEFYDLNMDEFTGVELGQPHDTTVGGAPARVVDLWAEEEGPAMAGRLALAMPNSKQAFALLGAAPPERWDDEAAALFDAVLASVRFFEPVAADEPMLARSPANP
jgi:hypothetical protein